MVKRIAIVLVVLTGILSIWYLGIRPYDLKISFKSKALPGTVEQTIKRWAFAQKGSKTTNTGEYHFLQSFDGFQVEWDIDFINDSLSKVDAQLTFEGSQFSNRLNLLMPDSRLKIEGYNVVKEAHDVINDHLTRIKVKINGESHVSSKFCVCVEEHTSQLWKAQGMMRNHGLINSFILANKLKADGLPFIEVLNWNQELDSLHFNFCFPIVEENELPQNDLLFYHAIKSQKAVKATYNGNYITSDRAWYELLNYANNNNFEVTKKPLEFFYSNPNIGENEIRWKAEVFLPLKQQ